jgi:ATP-dependent DNA helicase RecG
MESLLALIRQGEGLTLEFKQSRDALNRDVYETVCAFLNRHGGTILLGVTDAGEVSGIDISISIRDAIFREVASNILIHREYTNAFPAKLIIEQGQVRTENSSRPHGFGRLDPATFTPYPKNPVIARFFRQIGRADELGSGMRKMMKYGRTYGGADPELFEGDVFKMSIYVPDDTSVQASGEVTAQVTAQVTGEVTGEVAGEVTGEVLRLLKVVVGEMKRQEIQEQLGLKHEDYFREAYLLPAIKAGTLEMTIPDKPRSSKQKYRLTATGRHLLKKSGEPEPQ